LSIFVRVYAELRHYLPADWQDGPIDLPSDANVGDLLTLLGIPREEIGLVSLDGRIAQEDQALNDASEARIFPPIGGGQLTNHTVNLHLLY
jgi:sulfur carrier protein ThiS